MKALSHHLHSSIPKHLLTPRAILAVMVACLGGLLLFFSILQEFYVEFPDPEQADEGQHDQGLVVIVICSAAVAPSILPLLILPPFIKHSVLSLNATKTTDPNDGLPYDPTLPQRRWHPKISPYRFTVFLTPLAIGTFKAVLSLTESVTTLITILISVV